MNTGFEKFLRFGEGRRMKRLAEQAAYIATLEPEFRALSDAELQGKTAEFRQRLENGEERTLMVDGAREFGTIPALERPDHVVRAHRIAGDSWEVETDPL